jgi:hypothetical protein
VTNVEVEDKVKHIDTVALDNVGIEEVAPLDVLFLVMT